MTIIIAVTGGISSGKTTVAELFTALKVPIIDSDQLAHQLVARGTTALASIVEQFGQKALLANGSLSRCYLRQLLINDASAKNWIEELLHPLIYQESWRRLNNLTAPYVLWMVPLLIEKGWQVGTQRVLVIDCAVKQQLVRLMQRDQLTCQQAKALLRLQCKRRYRLAAADDIIDNSGSFSGLLPQVTQLHQNYLVLGAAH
ncbi:MAG: dephospho-CoA kinase [Candidatus Symbiodolus clandestinus]